MNIPTEMLQKYNMKTFEEYQNDFPEFTEREFYNTFLIQTDHIPNKIIEELIEDMATATALEFVTVFINFIKSVRSEYQDVLSYRKFARSEINRLETE